MANSRLTRLLSVAAISACLPAAVRATGNYDDGPPPTLPFYLDRLPAKPPALIFEETFGGPTDTAKPTDFKAALLSLAVDCEKNQGFAALLASTDKLLALARRASSASSPALLCNVLEDVRDLFAATPPVVGLPAARYLRWRVAHAAWFGLSWDDSKAAPAARGNDGGNDGGKAEEPVAQTALDKLAAVPAEKPLRAHWLYLRGALDYPGGESAKSFQQVVDEYPDDPRAEAARFMLARCKLVASRSHTGGGVDAAGQKADRAAARALFADYLKRYPQGRFAADVPGWVGALAFDEEDYAGALDQYIRQADVPGHPEVLKSAGFMCERCLSHLASANDTAALDKLSLHPRLAMSLIYLLVNSPESDNYDGKLDSPAQVARWRTALLPRLAAVVAAHKDAYASHDWQGRYLTILAQAASGTGDQAKALSLCEMDKDELARSDDLAFIRLVALERAHRLPEAIAAAGEFARRFPNSPFVHGAALRRVLALVDDHQAGAALADLYRLRRTLARERKDGGDGDDEVMSDPRVLSGSEEVYPGSEDGLSTRDSVLSSDTSGAETAGLVQITDALLCFAPLPELAGALSPAAGPDGGALDGADAANLRAVLVQRWLSEEENFAEAKKYATPAQWSIAAAALEKLAADALSAPAGDARAAACLRLADGWAAARGQLLFAPLETDKTRAGIFTATTGAEYADVRRRENGLALGLPADRVNHALASRDEWRHAFDWWQKAADAAPAGSPTRARALWSALRALPAMTLVSPYTFLRAGETGASQESRRLYDRLSRECPDSREAREFAVYYDLAPPMQKSGDNTSGVGVDGSTESTGDDKRPAEPDLSAAAEDASLPYGEAEYRWDQPDNEEGEGQNESEAESPDDSTKFGRILADALKLNGPGYAAHPVSLAETVARLRAQLNKLHHDSSELYLVNFLDDLNEFAQEPAVKLTPAAVKRYVQLRTECMSVEHWGTWQGDTTLPPVPGADEGTLNETVLGHIRAAYRAPEMAGVKDYLDFLVLAVIANAKFEVPIPGELQDAKEGDEPGKQEPVTYTSRDYPKLARLLEGYLKDYPHSRKREAARLLLARALYAASRPHPLTKFAVWPRSPHFQSGTIFFTHRQEPFEPQKIGAALNAYDREFPRGRYAGDIRNLRGLLAWRTQDWALALDLTLQTQGDRSDAVLQAEAGRRLQSIFGDGLTDETERQRCLAAIRARPAAVKALREFLPTSPFPLRALTPWLLAQL